MMQTDFSKTKNLAMTAPHSAASEAGMAVLRAGGNAVEAMVAAAATISVVYPHMTGLGGDGFWLIHKPGEKPVAIDASGFSAAGIDFADYAQQAQMPTRGGRACVTIAGAVSGWQTALHWAQKNLGKQFSLSDLFADAIQHCVQGVEVTESLANTSKAKFDELTNAAYQATFLNQGQPLQAGDSFQQPKMAQLLTSLAENGLADFYQGEIAQKIAKALAEQGSALRADDLASYSALQVEPLSVQTSHGTLFNLGAPTQGIASLLILALFDRLYQTDWDELQSVHHLVEVTKQAFRVRNQFVTDPNDVTDLSQFLTDASLQKLLAEVSAEQAMPWPNKAELGDTIWMGATDANGVMVSYIQSLYWEFGSGVVIPEYGLVWNNRGVGFSLQQGHLNQLRPKAKPFHTLNPALCLFKDGRRLVYGTMGGEGQPQTQAAIFHRIANLHWPVDKAVAEARWLLGRTWGISKDNLKLESALYQRIGKAMMALGHDVEEVADLSEMMGHAGAILRSDPNSGAFDSGGDSNTNLSSLITAATDPRSDGAALVEVFVKH